jgi:hypothetical protein
MLGRISWRGGLAATAFVIGLTALTADGSTVFRIAVPWLISLAVLGALVLVFGGKDK